MEDHPYVRAINYLKNSNRDLFSQITFAHDFQTADKILSSEKEFDLHILDADLPMIMPKDQLEKIKSFLAGEINKLNPLSYEDDNNYSDAFIPIYLKHLTEKRSLVYSMSRLAPQIAFLMNIPFYSKFGDRSSIEKDILCLTKHEEFHHTDVSRNESLEEKLFE